MLVIPLIRGSLPPYETIERQSVASYTGEIIAETSLAPSFVLTEANRRSARNGFDAMRALEMEDLLATFRRAARIFAEDSVGGLDPEDYARITTLSTGLPITVVRKRGLEFLSQNLRTIQRIIEAQSPDGSHNTYDTYFSRRQGVGFGFVPTGRNLAVVLPSNHPSVNVIWLIALAMKYPQLIRPSLDDLFTPLRLVLSLYKAGLPEDSLFFLPCEHFGAAQLATLSTKSVIFGGEEVARQYKNAERTRVFGPGRSKIVIGRDLAEDIELATDIVVQSMMLDGGRGCVNASSVITPSNAEKLAYRVAEQVSRVKVLDPLDPQAQLPAVKNLGVAESLRRIVEQGAASEARDITARCRAQPSLIVRDFDTQFLLPTVVLCDSHQHALFGKEYPFQFLTIAQVPDDEIVVAARNSLAVTVVSEDRALVESIVLEPSIKKVYTGSKYTCDFDPAEPHEGFIAELLFEFKAYRPLAGQSVR